MCTLMLKSRGLYIIREYLVYNRNSKLDARDLQIRVLKNSRDDMYLNVGRSHFINIREFQFFVKLYLSAATAIFMQSGLQFDFAIFSASTSVDET